MHTIYLVRHGRSEANQKGLLAGRAPKVKLDEVGLAQAKALGDAFSNTPIDLLFSSPLERCLNTAEAIKKAQKKNVNIKKNADFIECDYGTWTNKRLASLSKLSLWKTIQSHPSQVTFPAGESLLNMSNRAVDGLNLILSSLKKKNSKIVIVSHADLIKALLANALGMHLDNFQKIIIDPASVSTLQFNGNSYVTAGINEKSHLKNIESKSQAPSGAVLGGGAG